MTNEIEERNVFAAQTIELRLAQPRKLTSEERDTYHDWAWTLGLADDDAKALVRRIMEHR